MPHSDTRTVIPDYWYTNEQMEQVGQAWQAAQPGRLFIPTARGGDWAFEQPNVTGLRIDHLEGLLPAPMSMMLPLNRGGAHWTSIAIALTPQADGKLNVQMFYSDSMAVGSALPPAVKNEMDRITELFRRRYGVEEVTVTQSVYQHAWRQPDGSSCGPYALKNAARCLDQKGQERDPGRIQIRTEQLDMMDEVDGLTAIKGCSTNNDIDGVLVHWMLDCFAQNKDYALRSVNDIDEMCKVAAQASGKSWLADIYQAIDIEFGFGKRVAITARMRELLQKNELFVDFAKQYDRQMGLLRRENTMKTIDFLRLTLANATADEPRSYHLTAEIIHLLSRMHLAEAIAKVTEVIKDKDDVERVTLALGELIGSRGIEKDYSLKLIGLAKAYAAINGALQVIKTVERPLHAPIALLDAQVVLLHAAIKRNNASFLMQIAYVINDFFSNIKELLSCGRWEPEHRRVEAIRLILLDHSTTATVTSDDYKMELQGMECLSNAQKVLARENGHVAASPAP